MDRVPEPSAGGELTVLRGWLRFHRDALRAKCEEMSHEQLVTQSVPPSTCRCSGWSGT